MSMKSFGVNGAIEEEKDIDNISTSSKEIYLRDLLDPSKHPGIEFVQIVDQSGKLNTITREYLLNMVQRNPDLLKNTLESHPEKIPIEEVTN